MYHKFPLGCDVLIFITQAACVRQWQASCSLSSFSASQQKYLPILLPWAGGVQGLQGVIHTHWSTLLHLMWAQIFKINI